MTEESKTNNNYYTSFFKSKHLAEKDKYLFSTPQAKYKFNVIGAGMIGQEHIKVTMLEGRATINGIFDLDENSLNNTKQMFQQEFPDYDLKVYDTLENACQDPEVDGLIICTPNFTHLDIVKEAIKSSKHILVEKPMATTLKDAFEMKQLAEEYDSVFQIGLQYRYKPIYSEAIHEVMERQAVGDVKNISIMEHRVPFLDKVNQWNKFSDYSGGTLVEKCCHYFDLLNLFAQSKPKKVYATGDRDVNFRDFHYEGEDSDIIDNAMVTINYENGIKASFNLCMFSPMFYEEVTLCGDKGRLKAYENEDFLPVDRPSTHLEVLSGENGVAKIGNPCYPKIIQESGHHGATYYEHKYFVDNIDGNTKSTATADEGFWSIVVGVAADQSIKTGEVIDISEILEEIQVKGR
ncbi:gfo/Idh/MocA family oxidoreductase [Salibacterium salarium]|uniref:Gfo/Idh/MocA family oxidoreductase n=1 Tax=Salibacterium salarium TaxID=284579 RepID=A0A3R9Q4L3_9BACI|nr:Gfo/Idh/MocA family oxidoreductase [Salibacterium salarium]RSL33511.1 gfo/Idh/MocA family oxidoreductase [Salibacterium salarium]